MQTKSSQGNQTAATSPRWAWFSTLRVRLTLLILLAIVPLLVVMLFSAAERRRIAVAEAEVNALRLTRSIVDNQGQVVEGARQLLIALAQLPEVKLFDSLGCDRLFANLLSQYPRYANLAVVDTNGTVICSALPTTKGVSAADRSYFQRAVQLKDFAAGDYQIGRVTRKATINFAYPVLSQRGDVQAVVVAALDLSWLNQWSAQVQLPPDSVLLVVDRNGTILVRQPQAEPWVGRSLPDTPLVKAIVQQTEGSLEVSGLDGVTRLYAFTPLGFSAESKHAFVGLGIPKSVVVAEANQLLARNLTAVGIISIFALLATWFGSEWLIVRRVQALVAATRQLRAGNLHARTGLHYGDGELNQLALVFDQMAEALERREYERQQAAREREKALRALAKRNQELDQFAYVISHDLKAPLRAIANLSQWLEEDLADKLTPETERQMDLLRGRVHRMEGLIEGILQYSRIGRVPEQITSTAIATLIAEVIDSLAPPPEFQIEVETGMPILPVDRIQLAQVFANLISNAIKHHDRPQGRIQISVQDQEKFYEFRVSDDGPGIDPHYHEKVFVIFQTLQARDTLESTGIGLSLVKKIVESKGGTVRVESPSLSPVGRGSTFCFTWPKVPTDLP